MCIPSQANPQTFVYRPQEGADAVNTLVLNEDGLMSASLFNDNQVARDEAFQGLHNENNMKQHCVQHNYHDHANDDDAIYLEAPIVSKGGVSIPFPMKLHNMLDHIDLFEPELSNIIRWQPHGRCFLVKNSKEFAANVLPRFFDQKKYASFQRQLNLYGFNRITAGPDKGSYYHELFLRSKKILCRGIHRIKVKGTGTRMASNPEQEPNFYKMVSMPSSTFGPKKLQTDSVNAKDHTTYQSQRDSKLVTPPIIPFKVESDADRNQEMPPLQLPKVASAEAGDSFSHPDLFQPKVDTICSMRLDDLKDGDSKVLNFSPNRSAAATATPLTISSMNNQDHQSDTSDDLSFVFGNMPFHSIDTSDPYYFDRRNSFMAPLSSDESSSTPTSTDDDVDDFDTNIGKFIELGLKNDFFEQDMSDQLLDRIVNQDFCAL